MSSKYNEDREEKFGPTKHGIWLHPHCVAMRSEVHGNGIGVNRFIHKGEPVIHHYGHLFGNKDAHMFRYESIIPISKDYYRGTLNTEAPTLFENLNHSCSPNTILSGDKHEFVWIAGKDLEPGDEITSDFSTFEDDYDTLMKGAWRDHEHRTCNCRLCHPDNDPKRQSGHFWEFDCTCGEPECRKHIQANDHLRPDVLQKYGQHFTPHLLSLIAQHRCGEQLEGVM